MSQLHLTPRPPVSVATAVPAAQRAMYQLEAALDATDLPLTIRELVKIRASQINGCGFCLEMHHHDARDQGETPERLALISAFRESQVFSHEERVALAVTEQLTLVANGHLDPALEDEARAVFDEQTYAALIFAIAAINAWNRLAIAGHTVPGSLRAAQS